MLLWSYSGMGKMTVGIILTSLSISVATGVLKTPWSAQCSVWVVLRVVLSASPCLPGARMNLTRKTVFYALKILSPLVKGACPQPGYVTRLMTAMIGVTRLTVITMLGNQSAIRMSSSVFLVSVSLYTLPVTTIKTV